MSPWLALCRVVRSVYIISNPWMLSTKCLLCARHSGCWEHLRPEGGGGLCLWGTYFLVLISKWVYNIISHYGKCYEEQQIRVKEQRGIQVYAGDIVGQASLRISSGGVDWAMPARRTGVPGRENSKCTGAWERWAWHVHLRPSVAGMGWGRSSRRDRQTICISGFILRTWEALRKFWAEECYLETDSEMELCRQETYCPTTVRRWEKQDWVEAERVFTQQKPHWILLEAVGLGWPSRVFPDWGEGLDLVSGHQLLSPEKGYKLWVRQLPLGVMLEDVCICGPQQSPHQHLGQWHLSPEEGISVAHLRVTTDLFKF